MQQPARVVPIWFLVANWVLLVAAFATGLWIGSRDRSNFPEPEATALRLVHKTILESHVEAHDPAELLDRALAGMVKLDPYSEYVPPRKVKEYDEGTTGVYEGIGVLLAQTADAAYVRFPFPGGPAEKAGLLPADRILAVDGQLLAGLTVDQRTDLNSRVRGPAGSHLMLSVERRGQAPFDVAVERGPVQKTSVKWVRLLDADKQLGYLWISDFQNQTANEVRAALAALAQAAGGRLSGLVLDLRYDGGGLLEECVAVARMFVASGNIVTTKQRGDIVDREKSFDAVAAQCTHPDLPLVVLVNGRTASASEVLTGALQDHHRAAVVGTRSYGKGYVNTVYSWKNLDFRLKLTTAYYYTPSGRNIEHRETVDGNGQKVSQGGITPEREVKVDQAQFDAVYLHLREPETPAQYRPAVVALLQELGLQLVEPLAAAADPQLAAALDELRLRLPGAQAPAGR
jgi:carboxyl-terminal processing protease